MRAAALLIMSAWMFLTVFAGPVLATHKDGHQKPPACEKSQGQAPAKNKHCYPPAASAPTSQGAGPTFGATSPDKGSGAGSSGLANFPIWFIASSGVGLVTAGLLGRWVWIQSRSRRTIPAGLRLRPGSS